MKSKKDKKKNVTFKEKLLMGAFTPIVDKLLSATYDFYVNKLYGQLEVDNIISFEEYSKCILDKLKGGNN